MKRFLPFLPAAAFLLGTAACGDRTPSAGLPATFVWDKDQASIEPAAGLTNVWGGFTVRDGVFAAEKNTARFILWRKAGAEAHVSIEYVLRGKPCRFLINGAAAGELAPSTRPASASFDAGLVAGFNFLEFDKTTNDILEVLSVRTGAESDSRRPHLAAGETLTVGTGSSAGRLVFSGSGTLRVTEVTFPGGRETVRTADRRTKPFSRRIAFDYDNPDQGYAVFSAVSGRFDIVERSAAPKAVDPPEKALRPSSRPDIFIFLIDACRPDHLGLYGYRRPTSPNLDRLAGEAVVFDNAYAAASFTRSSVATLFTGLYPESHKVRILMNKLSERLLTIPVYLKAKGYRTSLFTATGNVSENMGFARGVDDYFPHIGEWRRGDERTVPAYFERWLSREGPLFSYVHFMEPHLPIVPPPPYLDMFVSAKDRAFVHDTLEQFQKKINAGLPFGPDEVRAVIDNYDAALAYVDGELGKLFVSLKARGAYDESLIIVLSDHGESLYERDYWGHGAEVYEETTRVPLIVKFPASMGLRGRVERVVDLAGAFPTVLDLFGQPLGLDGTSWLPAVASRPMDDGLAVSRSFTNTGDFGLRWRDWYAIINPATGGERLYRRGSPVFAEAGPGTESVRLLFKVRFLEWLARFAGLDDRPVGVDLRSLPKNEVENLRSLGYIK